jgi:hypothetical protein
MSHFLFDCWIECNTNDSWSYEPSFFEMIELIDFFFVEMVAIGVMDFLD